MFEVVVDYYHYLVTEVHYQNIRHPNGHKYRYHLFEDKGRVKKYDFNTEKHNSSTENMILILKIILKYLIRNTDIRIACSEVR